jgi:arsenite methyltransferase
MARDLMFQGEIEQAVQQAYGAITSGGGELVARRLYADQELAEVPSGAIDWALGVGNPVRYAMLRPGERALDVGSGGGIDTILAARRVGPGGKAVGLDALEETCGRGRRHAAGAGVGGWAGFVRGEVEEAARYPLFTPEVIGVMRRTIPPGHHHHVATGVIVKARKPG